MVAKQTKPEQPQLIYLLLAAAGLWLLWLLSPILTPFLLAAVLAYVCDPLVDKLQTRRVPRGLGVLIVLLLLIGAVTALVLILAPLAQHETRAFVERLPTIIDWFKLHALPWLQTNFGVNATLDTEQIKAYLMTHMKGAGSLVGKLLPSLKSGGMALIGILKIGRAHV